MTPFGTVVDTTTLLKVISTSLVAGIGVAAAFAVAIYGATRSIDMQRDNRLLAAGAFAALATAALAACVAAIVTGIIVMASK